MAQINESRNHLSIEGKHIVALVAVLILSAVAISCPPCKNSKNAKQAASRRRAARRLVSDNEKWAGIPSGRFVMGSPFDEAGRMPYPIHGLYYPRKNDWEKQHKITLTRSFLLKKTEVTQGEFKAIMGYNPSRYPLITFRQEDLNNLNYKVVIGKDLPANFVSWYEAAAFCNALSKAAGLSSCYECLGKGREVRCRFEREKFQTPYKCPGYRLPTEAEWEYAARSCTTTETYNGDRTYQNKACDEIKDPVLEPIAWSCSNSKQRTHRVGVKRPNNWGLYDMLGNVKEWCHDWCTDKKRKDSVDAWHGKRGERRVGRGGCYSCTINNTRAASISCIPPGNQITLLGFRPAKTINPPMKNYLKKEIESKRRKCLEQRKKRTQRTTKKKKLEKQKGNKTKIKRKELNKKELEELRRFY